MLTEDMDIFFNSDHFAAAVTYTPTSGDTPSSIYAIITELGPAQEEYVRGEKFATAEIEVQATDVATPKHGDTYTYDGKTWEHDPSQGVTYTDQYTRRIALRRRET